MNYFFNQSLSMKVPEKAWAELLCCHSNYYRNLYGNYNSLDICPDCRNSTKVPIPLSEVVW